MSNAIEKLDPGPNGKELVDYAENRPEEFIITEAKNKHNGTDESGINWSYKNRIGGPNQNSNYSRPAFIGLAHELAHLQDLFEHITADPKAIWSYEQEGDHDAHDAHGNLIPIYDTEKYAIFKENQVRSENGVPLRTGYDDTGNTDVLNKKGNNIYYNKDFNYKTKKPVNTKTIPLNPIKQ